MNARSCSAKRNPIQVSTRVRPNTDTSRGPSHCHLATKLQAKQPTTNMLHHGAKQTTYKGALARQGPAAQTCTHALHTSRTRIHTHPHAHQYTHACAHTPRARARIQFQGATWLAR